MTALEIYNILSCYSDIKPDATVTFANNKIPVTKVVYDENTNSINLR